MQFIPRQNTFHFKGEFKLIIRTLFSKDWRRGDALLGLERRFAEYIGCKHAILVPSVTFGMAQILKALVNEGSEVICPAFSHSSTPLSVLLAGAKPVFVDANYATFNIDVKKIGNKLTEKTKAIIVLHFGGLAADLESIFKLAQEHNLSVISDCAHSCGAEYKGRKLGATEDAACFSFGTGKNIDGFGGGIVTTNNEIVAKRIREALELYCRWPNKFELILKIIYAYTQWLLMKPLFFYPFTLPLIWISSAINRKIDILYKIANISKKKLSRNLLGKDKIRFSNLQAKIVLRQLDFLDARNIKTRDNAKFLTERLSIFKNIGLPVELLESKSVFLLYPIKVRDKWNFSFKLLKRGIDTRKKYFNACVTNCPTAENLTEELLYLPVYAELTKDDLLKIVNGIKNAI